MDYTKYIEIYSTKRFGKPIVKGTRISVYDVLNWMASGMTKQEVIEDYPELSIEVLNACLSYAADRTGMHRVA